MSREQERLLVKAVGDVVGYGNLMDLAQAGWRELLISEVGVGGGEFSIGPCVAMLVPCHHQVRDSNGHCEICCGSGYTTRWIAENVKPAHEEN